MQVVTRFAPSPTGLLHIGGARTALFNWLFSKANKGKFLLRIEDTDQARSTPEAVQAIFEGLKWLGLNWDGVAVFQMARMQRHLEVAEQLLESKKAYRCYLSAQEIEDFKRANPYMKIQSPWREGTMPARNTQYTIRLKVDVADSTTISDKVRGEVTVANTELDDMILVRSDGTPTYMFAVVIDDYDMQVTHVIRGDDHFTNTFRQQQIIKALSWPSLTYAHIPLIHGADGVKLSKRHGALGVGEYEKAGYLPEAFCNYLLRLGWSHGNCEIITKEEAFPIFSLEGINSAPARFDMSKLNFLNAHYISKKSPEFLLESLRLENDVMKQRVREAMPDLKNRAVTLVELQELAALYAFRQDPADQKSQEVLASCDELLLREILQVLLSQRVWDVASIKLACAEFAAQKSFTAGRMMQILRATIMGSFKSPGIYETMAVLGQEEANKRLRETILTHFSI